MPSPPAAAFQLWGYYETLRNPLAAKVREECVLITAEGWLGQGLETEPGQERIPDFDFGLSFQF